MYFCFQAEESASTNGSESGDIPKPGRLWVTMGLCWSSNTKFHGKQRFPYKDAAPLSAQLWMKLTPATVILQIVYSEPNVTYALRRYKEKMEGYGAVVKLVPAGDMECVVKTQIIRMFAYELAEVADDDIVMAADVDAFIMTPKITAPLRLRSRKLIWIYRYELSHQMGYTFMMQFTAARAATWKKILGRREGETIEAFVSRYQS